jgi:hypothetical protein
LMTFDAFLRATRWADPGRTYEQGVRYEMEEMDGGGGGGGLPVPVGSVVGAGSAAAASD